MCKPIWCECKGTSAPKPSSAGWYLNHEATGHRAVYRSAGEAYCAVRSTGAGGGDGEMVIGRRDHDGAERPLVKLVRAGCEEEPGHSHLFVGLLTDEDPALISKVLGIEVFVRTDQTRVWRDSAILTPEEES